MVKGKKNNRKHSFLFLATPSALREAVAIIAQPFHEIV